MLGFYVNDRTAPYTELILGFRKTIETRSRNTLRKLVGQRVALIRTGKGPAVIVGFLTITHREFCPPEYFDRYRAQTCIPVGDKYDSTKGKWFYYLEDVERCEPQPLPANAIRHGRSYVEF